MNSRYFSKSITIILWAILLLPLFFTPWTMFPWHFGKTMIFQLLVEAAAGLYLIRIVYGQVTPRRLSYVEWSLLIFLIISIFTAAVGGSFATSWWGNQARANGLFTWIHLGVWYWLLINHWRTNQAWQIGLTMVVGVGVIISFTGFWPGVLPVAWRGVGGARASGLIGNPAFLAGYLVPLLGLSGIGFFIVKNRYRYGFLGALAIFLGLILLTETRGAWLGVAAGFVATLAVASWIGTGLWLKRAALISLGLLLVGSAVIFGLAKQQSPLLDYVPRLKALTAVSFTRGTGTTRIMAWEIALQGIKAQPLLGWGWGNYGLVFNRYYNPQFLRFGLTETVWDKPHNWLLEVAINAGIIGLLSYLSIVLIAAYRVLRGAASEEEGLVSTPMVRAILIGALVAGVVQAGFLFETSFSLWGWFLALAFVTVAFDGARQEKNMGKKFLSLLTPSTRQVLAIGIGVVTIIIGYYGSIIPLRASYWLLLADNERDIQAWATFGTQALSVPDAWRGEIAVLLARRLTKFDTAPQFQLTDRAEAAALAVTAALHDAWIRSPRTIDWPLWAGQVYQVLGSRTKNSEWYKQAEQQFLLAKAISPRKQEVLFLLTKLYLSQEDFVKAIESQQAAVAADPEIGISHWLLGVAYAGTGSIMEAIREIELAEAKGFTFKFDQELYFIDLYAGVKNYPKVIARFKALHEADPGNVQWLVKLATAYALNGNKAEALQLAKEVVTISPEMAKEAAAFIKQYKLESL